MHDALSKFEPVVHIFFAHPENLTSPTAAHACIISLCFRCTPYPSRFSESWFPICRPDKCKIFTAVLFPASCRSIHNLDFFSPGFSRQSFPRRQKTAPRLLMHHSPQVTAGLQLTLRHSRPSLPSPPKPGWVSPAGPHCRVCTRSRASRPAPPS